MKQNGKCEAADFTLRNSFLPKCSQKIRRQHQIVKWGVPLYEFFSFKMLTKNRTPAKNHKVKCVFRSFASGVSSMWSRKWNSRNSLRTKLSSILKGIVRDLDLSRCSGFILLTRNDGFLRWNALGDFCTKHMPPGMHGRFFFMPPGIHGGFFFNQ